MSNFAFIADQFPILAETAIGAEKLIHIYPPAAITTARQSLETLVFWLYKFDKTLVLPYDAKLHTLMTDLTFKKLVPDYIWEKMEVIRKSGNKVIHGNTNTKVTEQDAIKIISQLFMVYTWFDRTYGSPSIDRSEPRKFEVKNIPNPEQVHTLYQNKLSELQQQNKAFEAQIAKQHEQLKQTEQQLAERTADAEQKEQLLAEIDSELAQKRAEVAQAKLANQTYNQTHPDKTDYNEAETRSLLIDLMLEEAGWHKDKNLKTEVLVKDFPSISGDGKVDYVLMGNDGIPLAVVEAKRTAKSVEEGQQQAKLYADSLEKQCGKRPIIFYTNGYQTYLWDDTRYPPRQIQGYYTQQELNRLISQRQAVGSQTQLSDIPVNPAIVERQYQIRAIKAMLGEFDRHQRAGLLVMATGTGKTRTVIALVDVLMRANRVQKVLFLADRTSLVRQAANNFKTHLPNTAVVNLVESREQTGRVYLSTYQTMMGLIDEKNEDGTRKFGTGFFDLVIIDEAHRSVYQKFGEIFRYFDSLLVGLTATPRDEVDRDTYHLFGLAQGMPTDYYSLEDAIKDGYLVPPKAFSVPLKFVRQGIKYDELSEEEKAHWDSLDWGDLPPPDEISASDINKFLFNTDTVDKMLKHLMENSIKVKGGDCLGKTIIFAVNQRHAEFIAERFNHHYPIYQGKFARIITHAVNYSQTLIDDFSKKDLPEPQIAISVDMLDTGIDVPEVVNLVFFKAVRSKVKFLQMIGRGTRLCQDLFGPEQHKTEFYIFDYCENFEYFNENPKGASGTQTEPLSKRLFKARVSVLKHLQLPEYQNTQTDALESKLRGFLHNQVNGMNHDNFIVRPQWKFVEYYQESKNWQNLDDMKVNELFDHLSGLPTENSIDFQDDLNAKLFDLLCYNLQLAILQKDTASINQYHKRIHTIANDLSTKANIPAITKQIQLIESILTNEYWEGINVIIVEELRERLRELIKLTDKSSSKIVYSVLDDEIEEAKPVNLPDFNTGVDAKAYKQRVEHFIKVNENHITIARLKRGIPLTREDLTRLEQFVYNAQEVAGEQEFKEHFGNEISLPEFIRSLVGLDHQAVKEAFSNYLVNTTYNERQIRFIEMIIDQLTKQGKLQAIRLYEPPFNQIHYEGIDGLFSENDIDKIFNTIDNFNNVLTA